MLKHTLLDWIADAQQRLKDKAKAWYIMPNEWAVVQVVVMNNSGSSLTTLQDLSDLLAGLGEELNQVDSESGEVLGIRDEVVYLYGLVVNSTKHDGIRKRVGGQ